MVDLDWHDFYEIGVDSIDLEHRKILRIMRAIRDAIQAENHDECLVLSKELAVEVENHFRSEEAYLEEINFPGLKEHIDYHKELLAQLNKIKESCEGTDMKSNLTELFDAMQQFLIDDIFDGDVVYKSFLEHKGLIPRKL